MTKKNTSSTTVSKDFVYQMVTDRIVSKLEQGIIPWRKPWSISSDGNNLPYNFVTKIAYNGINLLLLEPGTPYITWKQVEKLGYQVKEEEKKNYNIVVFFKQYDTGRLLFDKDNNPVIDSATGEQKHVIVPVLNYYRVYSIDQTTVPYEKPESIIIPEEMKHSLSEEVVNNYISKSGVKIHERRSDSAFYSPLHDSITVPKRNQFTCLSEFYSTLFHEMVHSTGHESRLDRIKPTTFGSHEYSKEELVAEIGASFLLNLCGIQTKETETNNVAYLQSWIKVLKDNVKMIVFAASQAKNAVNLITDGMEFNYISEKPEQPEQPEKPKKTRKPRKTKKEKEEEQPSSFSSSEDVKVDIYQLNDEHGKNYRFMDYGFVSSQTKINVNMYDKVYSCSLPKDTNLNMIYEKFNVDKPSDYKTYSLSVSDVIVLNGIPFYVDSFGFEELLDFFEEKKEEKKEEKNEEHVNTPEENAFISMRKLVNRTIKKNSSRKEVFMKLHKNGEYNVMTNSYIAVRTKKDISVIDEEKERILSFDKIFPEKNSLPNKNEIPPVEQLKEMIKAGKKQKKLAVFKDSHGTVIDCTYLLEAITHTDSNIYFSKDNTSALVYTEGNNLEYIMCPLRSDGSLRYGFNFIEK